MEDQQSIWVVGDEVLGKTVSVIGFYTDDSQEYAHYLRTLGVNVIIAIKDGDVDAREEAIAQGFTVMNLFDAAEQADLVQVW